MAVTRWCWSAVLIGAALTARTWARQEPGRDWLAVNGNDWRRMESPARQAYIEGFLAGAALSQALSRTPDTAAVRGALQELRRTGGLRFPYGVNVYAARVSDYYWWKNHLPLPTWYAFLEVNATLGRPISDSVP